ncbi:MAG TPA: amidohydrolase [Candidatus Cryptobacteroides merdipullorum]|uniref:Amidohydrolase n=1 Tax=Candidatus Cryptobacteroides merdipullorum TaxID=2840771 RepID=A0A9D1GQL5_9BACT|nr:amidohydrolase [Candidatus Cryptobacteroides merdipullorum]
MAAILLRDICADDVRKDILIQNGLIRRIEPAGAAKQWDIAGDIEVMDCSGKVAVPGFVNMHTHSPMSLMRGIGEDMVFQDWLDRIWKVEDRLDKEYVYWATKVACLEMIRTGTTTFNDQYWFFDTSVKAAREMGMRIATGYDIMDKGDRGECERQKEQCMAKSEPFIKENGRDGLIYNLAFHAIYSVSEDMMLWAAEYARKHGLNLHIHLCETRREVEDCKATHGGLTPVEYLDRLGILSPRLLAAHTLWVTPHDIELLAAHGVHCIHNINSNTKLASGYRFMYNEMRDAGINVCLGTDGCASSNNLDMLEAMKTSAIFQKAWRDDPSALPLDELLDMATVNGARALRFDGGRIAEGAVADISIIDTDNTFFLSPGPFLANFVYSAHSDCIDSVICDGKFLMRHREIPGEKEIISEARKVLAKIS